MIFLFYFAHCWMGNNYVRHMPYCFPKLLSYYYQYRTSVENKNSHASLKPAWLLDFNGGPGGIRTPDLLVRSQTLYPAELRSHVIAVFNSKAIITKMKWIVNTFSENYRICTGVKFCVSQETSLYLQPSRSPSKMEDAPSAP